MSTTQKAAKAVRKAAVSVISHRYVTQGFSPTSARRWVRSTARDLRSATNLSDLSQTRQLHRGGQVHRTTTGQGPIHDRLSYRDFLYLMPLNRKKAWLTNRVTAYRHVPGLEEHMPTPICTIFSWQGAFDIVRLQSFPEELNADGAGLLEVIRRIGRVQVQAIRWDRGTGREISFDGQMFAIDGWSTSAESVLEVIRKMSTGGRCVLYPVSDATVFTGGIFGFNDAVLRLYVAREHSGEASIVQAQYCAEDQWRAKHPTAKEVRQAQEEGIRRGWGKRRQRLSLGERRFTEFHEVDPASGVVQFSDGRQGNFPRYVQVLTDLQNLLSDQQHDFTFITVDIALRANVGFEIVDLSIFPRYPVPHGFTRQAEEFLRRVFDEQDETNRERGQRRRIGARLHRRRERLSRQFSVFQLRAQGFTGRASRLWVNRVSDLKKQSGANFGAEARSAIERGFDPAFAARFGINEKNRERFIALRDYLYVQPLNGKYAKWVRDRVSARSIFKPYLNSFEPVHYQVLRRDRELQIIPLSDKARRHGTDMKGLAAFLQDHGKLTLLSSAWKGRTARNVEFDGRSFLLDGFSYTPDEFEKLLVFRVREQFYVLGDQVQDSSDLSSLSSQGDVQLQVCMLNPAGTTPRPVEAFVVAVEDGSAATAFRRAGHLLGDEAAVRAGTRTKIADDQVLESQMAVDEQRSDGDDPGPGHAADDIRVEDDAIEESSAGYRLVSRVDVQTGRIESARAVVNGKVRVYEQHPVSGEAIARQVPQWSRVTDLLQQLCVFAPQLKFVEFSLVLTKDGPVITGISATPSYRQEYVFTEQSVDFLSRECQEKREESTPVQTVARKWLHQAKLKTRREFARAFYPQGLVPYQSVRWLGDMRRDLTERNGVGLKTKIWAYRNGFLSYRIPQYGITEENRHEFISDFEYRWLRHINKKYKYWLEDKISIKYIAAEFNDCLPAYYFYTTAHKGQNAVVPMMDCPAGYGATFQDVLRLAREKGVVALKPDEGSHGDGFYRLDYSPEGYALNGESASEDQVLAILQDTKNQYLVTEFIQMHPVLAEIYPHSVNTIRLIVFKKDGVTPQIGNAYLRIGSLKSGYVDNTAAGGMLAQIDPATGRFGNAQILEHGRVTDCPRHPDTGTLIEGTIPHWDYAVAKVLDIAASMPQLEYLGFDLAITPDGIMLPEINRSPDFPRIDKLTPETIDYLLYKLHKKKTIFGYDVNPPKKLISLPERNQG